MKSNLNEEIAQKINSAFEDTPYPGDKNIGTGDPFDGDAVEEAFRGKHWQNLSLELLSANHDKLSFLTFEAYRFYLPAYMLATIFHFDELDTIPLNLIRSLTPPESKDAQKWFLKRVESFNAKEKAAIRAFLEAYKELFPQGNWSIVPHEREGLERAIRFWATLN